MFVIDEKDLKSINLLSENKKELLEKIVEIKDLIIKSRDMVNDCRKLAFHVERGLKARIVNESQDGENVSKLQKIEKHLYEIYSICVA